MNGNSKTQFKAVICARSNDGRPSDLEFLLRSHCQKIKVVKKLSGAHLMIKQDKISLAVRAYFSHDLQDLNDNENHQRKTHIQNEETYDFDDDLSSFLKGFKVSIIFFILPIEDQRKQLGDPQSFFQRAQKLVQNLTQSEMGKIARVNLVSNPGKAVDLLHSFARTLHPSKEEKKREYFADKHKQLFLPQPTIIPMTSHPHGVKHVREAIAAWSDRFEFPPTEADVMCNLMGNLKTIATADSRVLQGLPLDPRTKQCMMQFFGTGPLEEQPVPSQQIQIGAEDPTSPLTMPGDIRQQQQQLQHQGQQAVLTHVYPQSQPHPSQRPYSTQPEQTSLMMGFQTQSQGISRIFPNANSNATRTAHHTNSFAQNFSQGFSEISQSQPDSHGRFGPLTRTINQETILLPGGIPFQQSSNYFLQMPREMQLPMQNPPGSGPQQHHQHSRPLHNTTPPAFRSNPRHGHNSNTCMRYPSQQSVASLENYRMHPGQRMTITPANSRVSPYNQPAITPMTARPRQMHSSDRNPQPTSFPPRRQRRFVP